MSAYNLLAVAVIASWLSSSGVLVDDIANCLRRDAPALVEKDVGGDQASWDVQLDIGPIVSMASKSLLDLLLVFVAVASSMAAVGGVHVQCPMLFRLGELKEETESRLVTWDGARFREESRKLADVVDCVTCVTCDLMTGRLRRSPTLNLARQLSYV